MKYNTKELWAGVNTTDNDASKAAWEQWGKNSDEYKQQLEKLQDRLGNLTYGFFTNENLHDGRLLSFVAGDDIDFVSETFDMNAHKPAARLKVLGADFDQVYTLNYKGVKRALFDYPTEEPLFHEEGRHIGDWGYDELTAVDDKYLRHEILFASGTTILIEFQSFSFQKEACQPPRDRDD